MSDAVARGTGLPIGRNDIAGAAACRGRWLQAGRCLLAVPLLLACLLLAGLSPAMAGDGRHYTVSGWAMEDGLPHNLVHAIAQDRDGFVWIGTWEGVVRFNGRGFTVFDRQNTPGAELSGVFSIVAEADGGVLFGTAADGVFRYHEGRWQHLGEPAAWRLAVTGMLRGHDGALWIASANRLLRMERDGRLREAGSAAGLPAARITALARDGHDDALLIGTESGLFRLHDGKAEAWGTDWAGTAAVRDLADDGEGGWLVAGDDGVHWRHADGRHERLQAGQRVDAVVRDRLGAVWMNLSAGTLQRHAAGSSQRLPVPGAVSPALFEDREGLVWVGSTDGLYRVAEGAATGFTRSDGLGSDYVRTVLQSDDGALWIGHANGLDRWHHGRMQTIRLTPGPARDTSVLALAYRDGVVWAGTYDRGVFRLDLQGRVLERIPVGDGAQPIVRALLPDADGGVWIGGTQGLSRHHDGRIDAYLDSEGSTLAVVQVLYRDDGGTLWIGTTGGMVALDGDGTLRHWKAGEDIPAQYVFDFLRDPGGDLWIASDRGLLRMRGERLRVYDHRHGLPRDKVFRIIDDHNGNLWLSSNQGVFRVARGDFDQLDAGKRRLLAVHVVDHSDGMPGSQGNGASMPAGWRASNGALLFPTSAGLALIDPDIASRHDRRVPPVVFESMAVDGNVRPPLSSYRLDAGTSRVAIGYAALSFRAPDKLRYRYRLQGFDNDWVDAGSSTEAVYTNLPPGRYRLEVQAMSLPLDWARQEEVGSTSMVLEVVPPLWQRTSWRVLAALLVLGAVVLGFWLRTASYRNRQRKLNRVIAERTEELREKNRALEAAGREHDALLQKLAHQATHDVLTGLPNRRAADQRLQQALRQALATGAPLCVALMDVDHFKRINDEHGHEVGDQVLQQVAAVLRCEPGAVDMAFAARHGGEEFLLVLESTAMEPALRYLADVRERIAALRIPSPDGVLLTVTVSIGVACVKPGQDTARTLLAAADRELYRAKREGRNRVLG